ncbi:hypothetical protein [Aporhodopirellula aestuarii]|uniref:Uncharacterized protein n=1 Tax=Aporhodopirellula aestuarii TaxID=2950107 RepID=A0ABT0U4D0_9BACT|nr:hypothetical protein [Aporhodopirellula aestuarii]MCM2371201.1 hypothetical protein [Aporhodopirellula aestuarii]
MNAAAAVSAERLIKRTPPAYPLRSLNDVWGEQKDFLARVAVDSTMAGASYACRKTLATWRVSPSQTRPLRRE